jgi:predicted acetyltransferase
MMSEWTQSGERLVPYSLNFYSYQAFDAYVRRLQDSSLGLNLAPGFVRCSTFWLIDKQQSLLGSIDLRHALNDHLQKEGGHIGFGIRPSQRGKGYAAEILRLGLLEAAAVGLQEVMLTCDRSNLASQKVITNNRGELTEEYRYEGRPKLRFTIRLMPQNK